MVMSLTAQNEITAVSLSLHLPYACPDQCSVIYDVQSVIGGARTGLYGAAA